MEKRESSSFAQVDAEYVVQMCYEFSKLLYDISEENQKCYRKLEERCTVLEAKCHEYEMQILESAEASNVVKTKIIMEKKKRTLLQELKRICGYIAKKVFMVGRSLTTRLGIKDRIKKSKMFRKLYLRGTIDKLRE